MSDNQIKENELRKVTGGAGERPTGFEKAKYDIGYSYDSGTLGTGIPNHHIIITVKGYSRVDNDVIYYNLDFYEESILGPRQRLIIEKPESYIDRKSYEL